MKRFQTTLTILLFLAAFNVNAQLSKTDADNLVLNTIVNDTTKDVYSLYEIICRGNNIMTADGREIQNPYDNAYV